VHNFYLNSSDYLAKMKRFLLKIKENMLLALLFCGMSFLLVVGGVVYYKYEAEKIKKSI